jgi:hypothetical protein
MLLLCDKPTSSYTRSCLRASSIRFVRINTKIGHGIRDHIERHLLYFGERTNGRDGNTLSIHLEVTAKVLPVFAPTESIRAESGNATRKPGCEPINHNLHVVAGRHNRAIMPLENLKQVRRSQWTRRMQAIPTLTSKRVAAKFTVAGRTPYIRIDAIFHFQYVLRSNGFIKDGARAEQVNDSGVPDLLCRWMS